MVLSHDLLQGVAQCWSTMVLSHDLLQEVAQCWSTMVLSHDLIAGGSTVLVNNGTIT